jgi:hypothetical protein
MNRVTNSFWEDVPFFFFFLHNVYFIIRVEHRLYAHQNDMCRNQGYRYALKHRNMSLQ